MRATPPLGVWIALIVGASLVVTCEHEPAAAAWEPTVPHVGAIHRNELNLPDAAAPSAPPPTTSTAVRRLLAHSPSALSKLLSHFHHAAAAAAASKTADAHLAAQRRPRGAAALGGGRAAAAADAASAADAAAAASRHAELDWADDDAPVPQPQLFVDERDGRRVLIWHPDDTLARDVLAGPGPPAVWLYSLLAADYEGAALLPHFLEHYARLGIPAARMLFVVNHNPAAPGVPPGALGRLTALLGAFGADYRLWLGQYSADAHLKFKLQVLRRVPLRDWVVLVDSDELHDYGGRTAAAFLAAAERGGANWVKGKFVDRVAADGRLAPVARARPIWAQFPLRCGVARALARADPTKVAAFRGFLRSGVGNHGIIPPASGRRYFGPAAPGAESARYGLCGAEDLFPLTPYASHWAFYRSRGVTGNAFLWEPRCADGKVPVHHFKWHAGVERSVADRLRHYRGDDLEEPCGEGGGGGAGAGGAGGGEGGGGGNGTAEAVPRFKFWRESERLLQGVVERGGVDVRDAELACARADDPARLPLPRAAAAALARVYALAAAQEAEGAAEGAGASAAAAGGVDAAAGEPALHDEA